MTSEESAEYDVNSFAARFKSKRVEETWQECADSLKSFIADSNAAKQIIGEALGYKYGDSLPSFEVLAQNIVLLLARAKVNERLAIETAAQHALEKQQVIEQATKERGQLQKTIETLRRKLRDATINGT